MELVKIPDDYEADGVEDDNVTLDYIDEYNSKEEAKELVTGEYVAPETKNALATTGDLDVAMELTNNNIERSLKLSQGIPAEKAARVAKMVELSKLPKGTVERNLATVEDIEDHKEFATTLMSVDEEGNYLYPTTRDWFAGIDNAAQSKDDIKGLTAVEQMFRESRQQDDGFIATSSRALQVGGDVVGKAIADTPTFLWSAANYPFNKIIEKAGFDFRFRVPEAVINNPMSKLYGKLTDYDRPVQMDQDSIDQIARGDIQGAAYNVYLQIVSNIPQLAALALSGGLGAGQTATLTAMAAVEATSANTERLNAGADPSKSFEAGVGRGAAEYIGEKFTLGLFEGWTKDLYKKVGEKTFKKFVMALGVNLAEAVAVEGPSEGFTSVAQALVDYATGKPDALKGLAHDFLNSILVGSGTGAGVGSAKTAFQFAYNQSKYNEAKNRHEKLVNQLIKSKLREANPKAYEEFLQTVIANEGTSEKLSIPIETFNEFFQEDTESRDGMLKELGVTEQVDDAETKGKEIEISTAKYFTQQGGSDFDTFAKDSIRYDPDGMNGKEVSDASKEIAEDFRTEQKELEAFTKEEEALAPQIEEIKKTMMLPKDQGGFGLAERDADTQLSVYLAGARVLARAGGSTLTQFIEKTGPTLTIEGKYVGKDGKIKPGVKGVVDTDSNIRMFDTADMSTFLHEVGHIFTLETGKLVEAGLANEDMIKDLKTLAEFSGGDLRNLNDPGHEKIARAFETYLKEGKAPSKDLARAFNKIREWLTAIYSVISTKSEVKINDEVRGVFDRMLASEQEITEVQKYYKDKQGKSSFIESLKLTGKRVQRLNAKLLAAREKALDLQVKKAMRAYLAVEGMSKKIKELSTRHIDSLPVYKAIDYALQNGKLNEENALAVFGEEGVKQIKANHRGLISKDGKVIMSEIALNSEYKNTSDLTNEMLDSVSRKKAIDAKVDQVKADRESQIRASLELQENIPGEMAYHNEAEEDFLFEELKLIAEEDAKKRGIKVSRYNKKIYRDLAKAELALKKVRAAISYKFFSRTEQRWANEAIKSAEKGDLEGAKNAKEKQVRNHAYVMEAIAIREYVDKKIRALKKIASSKKGNIRQDYHDAILHLLNTYGITDRDPARPDAFKFDEVIASFSSRENPALLPSVITNPQKISYKDLTVEGFQDLVTGIEALKKRGVDAQKIKSFGKEVSVDEKVDEILDSVKDRETVKATDRDSKFFKVIDGIKDLLAETIHIKFDFKAFDGFKNLFKGGRAGPLENIFNSIFHKQNEYLKSASNFKSDYMDVIGAALGGFTDRLNKTFGSKVFQIPGVQFPAVLKENGVHGWTPERIMAVVLNLGNTGNYNAVKEGLGLTDTEIQNIVNVLNVEDLRIVQFAWESIDTLFKNMDDTFYEMNGYRLKKVERAPLKVISAEGTSVELQGGYYPLHFDPDMSRKVAGFNEKDLFERESAAIFHRNTPKDSFSKDRTGGKYPIKLEIQPLFKHIEDTLRYTYMAEILEDAHKVFKNNKFADAYTKAMGKERYELLTPWLSVVARPNTQLTEKGDRILGHFQKLAAISMLGGKILVGAKQALSLTSTARKIGPGATAHGMWELTKNPFEAIKFVEALSIFMKDRGTKIEVGLEKNIKKLNPFKGTLGVEAFGKKLTLEDLQDIALINIRVGDVIGAYSTWLGAYYQELNVTGDSDASVRFANEIVADTQPVFSDMHKNLWQLGGRSRSTTRKAFKWTVAPFTGWVMKAGSMTRTILRGWREGKISTKDFAKHVVYERLVPPLLVVLMQGLLRGDDLDEAEPYLYEVASYSVSHAPYLNAIPKMYKYGTDGLFELAPARVLKKGYKAYNKTLSYKDGDAAFNEMIMAYGELVEFGAGVPVISTAKDIKKIADAIVKED